MKTRPSIAEMQRAYQKSDATYDGIFFLGVRTTGIFCRPSCPARKPLPRNVVYFATAREALFAGYRPCRRCNPMELPGSPPPWVTSLLAEIERDPILRLRDGDLRERGIDPAAARRYFRKHYGMTFQDYSRARRLGRALLQIRQGTDLDEVILGHGYESHSGFREAFARTFGRPPGRSRKLDCIVTSLLESPLGPLVASATSEGVCLLEFTDRRMLEAQFKTLRRLFSCTVIPGKNEHLVRLKDEMAEYFAGSRRRFTVPLVFPGTPFQCRVWEELLRIPYGETRSYEAVSRAMGAVGAHRAVARCNGLNRVAILIPCHRVVNKDGRLGGYGGGLWRKQYLLDLERTNRRSQSSSRKRGT
ncbi:MAG: methylated-DNA--[protein]-cysteine S-methyltransferase [Candidatus Eisenbacteria bacterium]|nr:methylated-DNA--[protein]-cysteine S-methyltransferase [Candidatus Eisenbacteria bacterium]